MDSITPELTQSINAAKAAGHSVFSIKLSGKQFIYRSINRSEFRQLQKQLAEDTEKMKTSGLSAESQVSEIREKAEERLIKIALLSDSSTLDQELAGAITTIADLVMQASGFGVDAEPTQL